MITYDDLVRAGGIIDGRKYRYVLDFFHDRVLRILLSDLGTTAVYDPESWKVVKIKK